MGYVFYEFDYGVLRGSLVFVFYETIWATFCFFCFCLSGLCLFVKENIRLVIWLGRLSGGGSLQIISCSYFLGPSCVLVLYGFYYCCCYSRCRSSLRRAGWVPRPCLMLWGIISCSIPSQEGVYVFFIRFPYVNIFLFSDIYSLFSVCVGGFLSDTLSANFFTERSLGAKN